MRRLLAPNTKKAGKTRTMYFPTAHSCNLRYEWNYRNSFHHCEDFSWATRSEGRHISTRRRLKKRSHTPKTVSYFKAKVLTSTTRIVSFEAKKAVRRFQSPPFTIYGAVRNNAVTQGLFHTTYPRWHTVGCLCSLIVQ